MRPRSLSVACDQSDRISKKFEGVSSDHDEEDSDADENGEEPHAGSKNDWSIGEYEMLVSQLRSVLPKNDTAKCSVRLNKVCWKRVAFGEHSPEEVQQVTVELMKKIRRFRSAFEMLDDLVMVVKKGIYAGKPKAPNSAYNFFVKEKFASCKEQSAPEEQSASAVLKKLGEMFANLSAKKKQKYDKLALEAKEAYKIDMEKYYKEHPEAATFAIQTSKKQLKKPERKNVTPFGLFADEKLKDNPFASTGTMKNTWEKLELSEKLKYVRAAYMTNGSKLTKTEKSMLEKAHGKPELVSRTVCEYYIKNYAERDIRLSVMQWRKQKAIEFKNLPRVRQLQLELELRHAQADYVRKYQQYIEDLPENEKEKNIEYLQAYMESRMDKTEKKKFNGKPIPDLTGCTGRTMNDITDLPIAESTTHEIEPSKRKSKKNSSFAVPTTDHLVKPLKSILKSPPPVAASPKRKAIEPVVEKIAQKKKHKSSRSDVETESDSSSKKSRKTAKKEKDSDNGADSSFETHNARAIAEAVAEKMMAEPKRPPRDILKYYKKFHYLGKLSKLQDSFDKLSKIRKKAIEIEMKDAQTKYIDDLKRYLACLPPSQVSQYVKNMRKSDTSADEQASDEEDENTEADSTLARTKEEPQSSSEDDTSDDDD